MDFGKIISNMNYGVSMQWVNERCGRCDINISMCSKIICSNSVWTWYTIQNWCINRIVELRPIARVVYVEGGMGYRSYLITPWHSVTSFGQTRRYGRAILRFGRQSFDGVTRLLVIPAAIYMIIMAVIMIVMQMIIVRLVNGNGRHWIARAIAVNQTKLTHRFVSREFS